MSNLWSHACADEAARVGSFAIERRASFFTPWGEGERRAPKPKADYDPEGDRAEAYAQGYEEGRRTSELEMAADRAAMAQLMDTLEVLQPQPTNALALLLAETVDRLVRQICGEVEIDAELLTTRCQAAAALVGAETEPARLRLHPEDLPLVDPALLRVGLIGDETVERGALVLETGQGWIEDGPAVRLDRLRAELDRIGAPL
jgi:flagellar assembly protein FliH